MNVHIESTGHVRRRNSLGADGEEPAGGRSALRGSDERLASLLRTSSPGLRSEHTSASLGTELGTWLAVPQGVHPQPPKRVAVAITSHDGNTLCGFRTTAPPGDAGRLFASSVSRLRRAGPAELAPVVLSIEAARKNYSSLRDAERGLESALELSFFDKATRENPCMP